MKQAKRLPGERYVSSFPFPPLPPRLAVDNPDTPSHTNLRAFCFDFYRSRKSHSSSSTRPAVSTIFPFYFLFSHSCKYESRPSRNKRFLAARPCAQRRISSSSSSSSSSSYGRRQVLKHTKNKEKGIRKVAKISNFLCFFVM